METNQAARAGQRSQRPSPAKPFGLTVVKVLVGGEGYALRSHSCQGALRICYQMSLSGRTEVGVGPGQVIRQVVGGFFLISGVGDGLWDFAVGEGVSEDDVSQVVQ